MSMTPKLSILICSLQARAEMLCGLLDVLYPQLVEPSPVEVLLEVDNGERVIGGKRNRLLNKSAGQYVCFIDDDDKVPADYVSQILTALDTSPDCVGFNLAYYVDGNPRGTAIHSLRFDRYGQRRAPGGMMLYERTPNHLNPIRREIALQVRFPELNHGEDSDYAMRIRLLLKTEVFIDRVMYHYLYRSKK